MANLVPLPTHAGSEGALTVADGIVPFEIRRVYFLHDLPETATRAGHRHKKTRQFLVCVVGGCDVEVDDGRHRETHSLTGPAHGLLLEPDDWHMITGFLPGTVIAVLASEPYDPGDYIVTPHA